MAARACTAWGGRAGRQIALHKVVQRHVEDLAQLQQLVHFGIGLLGLPLRDGLTADAEHEGQLFLGHRMGSAKMLKVIAEAHGGLLSLNEGRPLPCAFGRREGTRAISRRLLQRTSSVDQQRPLYLSRKVHSTNLRHQFPQRTSAFWLQTPGQAFRAAPQEKQQAHP